MKLFVNACFFKCKTQGDDDDDGKNGCGDNVDTGSDHFGGAGNECCGEVASRDQKLNNTLADVEHKVGESAAESADDVKGKALAVASAQMRDKTGNKSHHEEENKGEGSGCDVCGVYDIKEHGTDSRSQTAAPSAEEETGQQTEDVAYLNVGRSGRGGDLNAQEVCCNKAYGRHKSDHDDVVKTEFGVVGVGRLIRHCKYLL